MSDARIYIFTGHFGSGKTEVAVNFAMNLAKQGKKTAIVDLDIVNPYFRTKDAEKPLTQQGVRVIAPEYANTNVDMPTLPSDILSVFADKDLSVVFDVGGDDDGATALGPYFSYFSKEDYKMYLVINTNRPLTQTSGDIIDYMHDIEAASRLKIHALVNNTNLSYSTEAINLTQGQAVLDEVSRQTGIQTELVSVQKSLIDKLDPALKDKAFGLDLYLQIPWL